MAKIKREVIFEKLHVLFVRSCMSICNHQNKKRLIDGNECPNLKDKP